MKNLFIFISLATLFARCGFIRKEPISLLSSAEKSGLQYDAIIVPGCPYDGNSWSTTMNYRVNWSVYLYNKGIAKNIIFSGSSVYSPYTEAKVMALYAEKLGVPANNIFVEPRAEHSTENVYYSYLIAKENGFEQIALATDPFQNNSVQRFISKHDLPIGEIPAVFDSIGPPSAFEPEINNSTAFNVEFESIKDREGFFKRLSGTFGKNINWHENDLPTDKLIKKYRSQGRLIETIETAEISKTK